MGGGSSVNSEGEGSTGEWQEAAARPESGIILDRASFLARIQQNTRIDCLISQHFKFRQLKSSAAHSPMNHMHATRDNALENIRAPDTATLVANS